ncbi:MAG: hypothetical protein LBH84_02270 [Prevotellaceae bacterium]|jgi:hypothetical protein|nr:hypothetical protein [Prevotellaceae bacterium]
MVNILQKMRNGGDYLLLDRKSCDFVAGVCKDVIEKIENDIRLYASSTCEAEKVIHSSSPYINGICALIFNAAASRVREMCGDHSDIPHDKMVDLCWIVQNNILKIGDAINHTSLFENGQVDDPKYYWRCASGEVADFYEPRLRYMSSILETVGKVVDTRQNPPLHHSKS